MNVQNKPVKVLKNFLKSGQKDEFLLNVQKRFAKFQNILGQIKKMLTRNHAVGLYFKELRITVVILKNLKSIGKEYKFGLFNQG